LISCTRSDQSGPYLHALVADAGAERRRDEEKHERALFQIGVAVAAVSTSPPLET
jgi:hypothetical protein